MYNLEQTIISLLEQYPQSRKGYNELVAAFWLKIGQLGQPGVRFDQMTPLESICREARKIWAKRPDLSPEVYKIEEQERQLKRDNLFKMVEEVFPGTVVVE